MDSIKLIGRYGGLTGKTWVEGVGNKFLLVQIFGLAKGRSEEHTSELQSPLIISYAVFCLKKIIGRYGGLTGKTLVEGVGNKFFSCWDFWASKREKVDQLNACTSVHRTTKSMLNQVR